MHVLLPATPSTPDMPRHDRCKLENLAFIVMTVLGLKNLHSYAFNMSDFDQAIIIDRSGMLNVAISCLSLWLLSFFMGPNYSLLPQPLPMSTGHTR
jgi:hypothetical protein